MSAYASLYGHAGGSTSGSELPTAPGNAAGHRSPRSKQATSQTRRSRWVSVTGFRGVPGSWLSTYRVFLHPVMLHGRRPVHVGRDERKRLLDGTKANTVMNRKSPEADQPASRIRPGANSHSRKEQALVCLMPDGEVTSNGLDTARDPSPTPTLADVQTRLGLPAQTAAWLERLNQPGYAARLALPDDDEATRLLEQLGVDPADRAATLAARPDPVAHPALWWILDRLYRELLATMGRPVSDAEHGAGWPSLPTTTGALGQHLHVWAFLAILPHVRGYHAEQRVPDAVSQQSLADLGGAMAAHRQTSGTSGLGATWALPLIFRGAFYKGLCRWISTGTLHPRSSRMPLKLPPPARAHLDPVIP